MTPEEKLNIFMEEIQAEAIKSGISIVFSASITKEPLQNGEARVLNATGMTYQNLHSGAIEEGLIRLMDEVPSVAKTTTNFFKDMKEIPLEQ